MLRKPEQLKLVDYKIFQTIGFGSTGRIKIAFDLKNEKYVAIKYMSKYKLMIAKHVDHTYNELKMGYNLRHPFICESMGLIQDHKYLMLVMEFLQGGSLANLLREVVTLNKELTAIYTAMLILALEYLHAKNIIHRNIKPENLIFSNTGFLKLIDLGFCKIVKDKTFTICGTPEYMAPEMILNKGGGKSMDFWALGILIYEMMIGVDPFSDETYDIYNTLQNIVTKDPKFPKGFDKDTASLIKRLLQKNTCDRYGCLRMGMEDIKMHRFYYKVCFQAVLAKQIQVPIKPNLSGPSDVSYFDYIPDSQRVKQSIHKSEDPFKEW